MPLLTYTEGAVHILRVPAINLDAALAPELLAEATPLVHEGLVLDLTNVQFIDSSGLSVLCRLLRKSGSRGLVLAGVSQKLETLLGRVPEAHLPPRYATLKEAVQLLLGGGPAASRIRQPFSRGNEPEIALHGKNS